MVLQAPCKNTNAVIVSKDIAVLILLVHMCTLKNINSKWCMKTDNDKSIDVGKIVEYYDKDVILKLPHIHDKNLIKTLCCKQSNEFTTNHIIGCDQILLWF